MDGKPNAMRFLGNRTIHLQGDGPFYLENNLRRAMIWIKPFSVRWRL